MRFIDPDGRFVEHFSSLQDKQALLGWARMSAAQEKQQDDDEDPPTKKKEQVREIKSRVGEKVYLSIDNPFELVYRQFVPRTYTDSEAGITYEVDVNGRIKSQLITGNPMEWIGGKPKIPSLTVLGKFPDYINLTSKLNARRFNIPIEAWNKMSPAEQWAANVKFLDRTIARGDKIILSNPVKNINEVTGYLRKELDYLISKGYKLSSDGTQLIK